MRRSMILWWVSMLSMVGSMMSSIGYMMSIMTSIFGGVNLFILQSADSAPQGSDSQADHSSHALCIACIIGISSGHHIVGGRAQ